MKLLRGENQSGCHVIDSDGRIVSNNSLETWHIHYTYRHNTWNAFECDHPIDPGEVTLLARSTVIYNIVNRYAMRHIFSLRLD